MAKNKEKQSLIDVSNTSDAKPIVVWLFGKGGVGKTMTAQVVRIALQRLGHQVVALDADASNSSFKRQVPEALLLNGADAAEIVESIESELVQQTLKLGSSMVIDTGNGTDALSREWFESEKMDTILLEHGVKVFAVTVVDSSLDSASHLLETVDSLSSANHIVVKNLGHTPGAVGAKAFIPLFQNEEFHRYAMSSHIIEMPRLVDAVALDVIGARLHDVANNTTTVELNPFVAARTKSWLTNVLTEFEAAFKPS
jgi:hypothetical protein